MLAVTEETRRRWRGRERGLERRFARRASGLYVPEELRLGPPPPPPPPPPFFPFPFAFWKKGVSPQPTGIEPAGGPTTGGTNVTITGTHFTGQTTASVGGVPLSAFSVVSDTQITGTTGAGMTADSFLDVVVGSVPTAANTLPKAFSTQNATTWLRSPPTIATNVVPWVNEQSAGTSGTFEWVTNRGTPNPNGTALKGFPSAGLTATSGTGCGYTCDHVAGGTQASVQDLLTLGSYTIMGLLIGNSAPAANPGPNFYQNPTIFQADAHMGMTLTSTGVGVYHFNGATWEWFEAAWTLTSWAFVCLRYGGAIGAGKAQVDVNSTAGTPTTLSAPDSLATGPNIGSGPFNQNTVSYDWNLIDITTFQSGVSDAIRDSYKGYLTARYGLP